MTYIFCAFEAEARALIDKYKLSKDQSGPFTRFHASHINLFISGMGQEKATICAEFVKEHFPIHPTKDSFINLGICGAHKRFAIGELLEVETLYFDQFTFTLKTSGHTLQAVSCKTVLTPVSTCPDEDIVEMEAGAFIQVLSDAFSPEHFHVLKLVSDHCEPIVMKKQWIISLFQQQLKGISDFIPPTKGQQHAS